VGDTKSDVLAAVVMVEPEPLVEKFPDKPAEINGMVHKTLRKDREQRYQSAKELLLDLKSLRQELEFETKMGREVWRVPQAARAAPTEAGAKRSTAGRPETPRTISELFINEVRIHPRRATLTLGILLIALIAAGVGVVQLLKSFRQPESFQSMRLAKLTLTGNVEEWQTAISPDGKYAAYVVREEAEQSLWIKQIATSSNVQIVAPAEVRYRGLTFSRDGNYVYYVMAESNTKTALYQIPALGGPPRTLLENAEGPITFSPEGEQMAFLQSNSRELSIARADGSKIRTIAKRTAGEVWTTPAWSPDGHTIVCGVYSPVDSTRRLVQVSVSDGSQKPLAGPAWLSLNGLCWLPDSSGLLVAGRDFETRLLQIWLLSYPDGKTRRVTNDLANYLGISITEDGQTLASVQTDVLSNIWISPETEPTDARRITFETNKDEGRSGLSISPDGRIVYSARTVGIWDLWIIDRDGRNNKQLTFNSRGNYWPSVTPDGQYIVFTSLRTGSPNLWRIGLDGGNAKQLTEGEGLDGRPIFTPDSKWVIYEKVGSGRESSLWKVSIDGGPVIQLTKPNTEKAALSPDGKFIACVQRGQDGRPEVVIIPSEGGEPIRNIDSLAIVNSSTIRWTADGSGLIYIDNRDRVYNLWTQPIVGGTPKQLTFFSSDRIFGFDVSTERSVFAMARGHQMSDVVLINRSK